ncbi:MAG: hypothetical protein BGO91_08635 [Leifsonia sp. 71-9]|nr:MAG: hypothetical protein BGO91_08635 [Leifsonia sp. 71-9]
MISGIITIVSIGGTRQQLIDSLQNSSTDLRGVTTDQFVDGAIALGTTWAIVTLIFWAIVFVLFAFFARRGANWARIVLTVLTVISLLNVAAGLGAGALQVVLSIIAVVLLWLRPSSDYFNAVKAAKAPRA